MLRCVLGERNSGKSVFVEEQVKKENGTALYIATLPDLEMYRECISRHRMRRPSSWECLELFRMSAGEILAYPYGKYRNVILDNLSYYVLFWKYSDKDAFVRICDHRFFSLIHKLAADRQTTVHFIDTPLNRELLEGEEEDGTIRRLFAGILEEAGVIERYYPGDRTERMTAEEGKGYMFRR